MIPENAIELVKRWEGFHREGPDGRAYPYRCPAGVWTIGYGSTRLADGSPVRADTPPITRDEAEALMRLELSAAVLSAVRHSPALLVRPEALGAIASFIFNLGPGRYYASTLRRRINEGRWEDAQLEIRRWVYAGGRKLAGLVARRADEARFLL